jgi:hypothetical protein
MSLGGIALVLALFVSACAEGYPPRDTEGLDLTPQMSQEQALQALNSIGSRRHLEHRWRYRVTQACELEVSAHRFWREHHSGVAPLANAQVLVRKPDAGGAFHIIMERGSGQDAPLTVLESDHLIDVSQVQWLLKLLPRFCR